MFRDCQNLKTIYAGDGWSTGAVTDSAEMFYGSTNLKGGAGTTFDSSFVDKTYARIDRPGVPGYFTAKS